MALVLDVGANRGQYGEDLRRNGYTHRIESFEPLADAHAELVERAAGDARWTAHRLALSDEAGELRLGTTDNFASALKVEDQLAGLFPGAVPSASQAVPSARLDELDLDLPSGGRTLLKVDVQGYELRVLAGAAGLLPAISVVETELSVVPLYAGQPLMSETLRVLEAAGFRLAGLEPVLRDWRTGEHLQFDGTFVRRE